MKCLIIYFNSSSTKSYNLVIILRKIRFYARVDIRFMVTEIWYLLKWRRVELLTYSTIFFNLFCCWVCERDLSFRYKCFSGLISSAWRTKCRVNWLWRMLLCRCILRSRNSSKICGCSMILSRVLIAAAESNGGNDAEKQYPESHVNK